MKNLFLTKTRWLVTIILLTALGIGNVWGDSQTFTYSDIKATQTSATKTPITVSIGGTVSVSGQQFRFASGTAMTVTSSSGNITRIDVTTNSTEKYISPLGDKVSSGKWNKTSATKYYWSGDATSVTLTPNSAIRITQVVVTYSAVSCKSISPSLSYASVGGTTLTVGSSSSGSPTITGNTGSGTVTYSSSNTSVATVNSNTGVVTAVAAGNATITASIAAKGDYCEGSATANFTIEAPRYTVSFNTGTGNPTQADITEASAGAGITLPDGPTPACSDDGWVFVGWAESSCSETTTAPELLAAGDEITPESDMTLYAVYRKLTSGTSTATFNAADISNLTTHSTYNRDWRDNTGGIELYISDGQHYTGGSTKTWTVTKGTSNYALVDAHTKISSISITISGTNYKVGSVDKDAGTAKLSTSGTSQTVTCSGDVTQVYLRATSNYQIRMTTFTVTYYNAKFDSNPTCQACVAPTSVTITGTNKYLGGQKISLTAAPEGGTGEPSYQWQKKISGVWRNLANDGSISGVASNNLQISSCTHANSGGYRCIVSTGDGCETKSHADGTDGYGVHVFSIHGKYTTDADYSDTEIIWTSETTGTATIHLNAKKTYLFKVWSNNGYYYGHGAKANEDFMFQPTTWDCGTDNREMRLFTTVEGDYTFTVNIEHGLDGSPYVNVQVGYPSMTHPNSGYVYVQKFNWQPYLHYWYDNSHPLSTWGSDPQLAANQYTSICGTDYWCVPVIDYYCNFIAKDAAGNPSNTTGDQHTNSPHPGQRLYNDGSWKWGEFSTYTITYAGGDGSTGGPMASHTGLCSGSSQQLTVNAFSKAYHTFNGWSDGNGHTYADQAMIENIQSNINLTAQWTPEQYNITATLTNVTSTTSFPVVYTYTGSAAGVTYTFAAADGFRLPDAVTVTGSTYTWDQATGQLTLTGTISGAVSITISGAQTHTVTWMNNGSNYGDPVVYDHGAALVLPASDPSAPSSCSGKVFVGWTSDPEITSETSTEPTIISAGGAVETDATYRAVFATSSANPLAGTVIWDEPFTGFSANAVPTAKSSGATVYNSTELTYACADGGGTTKIYSANLAGGTSPELLVAKSGGSLTVSNIPTAGQTELTLSYKSNAVLDITSGTGGVMIGDASVEGNTYTRTITISQSPAVNNFSLAFTKSTTGNARLDDIHLVVPGSGTMTDYVTLCAPSWTITYDKNTSDPVTNLPSPTSVLQSTGSGTLSNTVPERATYTFSGWAETTSGAVAYVAGGSITGVSADKTLYAVWTKTPVEELLLNYSELNKYVGDDAVTLAVTSVVPDGADMSVTWSSSNPSVAPVVAATGVVSFDDVGTATITATSTVTGTTTAVCYVTVRNKPTATFVDLIHNGNGTDLSTYYLQNVAGTSIVFPTLSNTEPGTESCEDQHYIFVGWTTSDNNDDPQDHLVTSDALENDVNKTFYAIWADGVEGSSYTQLTSNSFETAPTKYVIGVNSSGTMYYFNSCAKTGENNSWGYTTKDPTNNPPIQFTLSGTASELVATSTETTARYIVPLTTANFKMSTSSQTLTLNADGTIHNTGDNNAYALRGNSTNLRWYSNNTGNPAYFYKVEAGSAVSYRTSCCADPLAAPSVTATNTAYTVTLTWNAVAGATGYEVSWNNGAWTAATSPVNKTSLTASTTYTYKVRATYNEAVHCGARVASGNVTTDDVYSVTYSGGTGTGSCSPTGSVAAVTYEAGATVTLAATNSFSMTSNTFAAWVVKDADDNVIPVSNNQFTMPAKNVTVTATWTAVQDKYYDRMHDGTDALHGGIADGEGKYYLVLEGCNYTVPALTDDAEGDTDCHTTHFKLLGWIAQSRLKADGQIKPGEERFIFQGGGTKSATGATYYAIWAIMTE